MRIGARDPIVDRPRHLLGCGANVVLYKEQSQGRGRTRDLDEGKGTMAEALLFHLKKEDFLFLASDAEKSALQASPIERTFLPT